MHSIHGMRVLENYFQIRLSCSSSFFIRWNSLMSLLTWSYFISSHVQTMFARGIARNAVKTNATAAAGLRFNSSMVQDKLFDKLLVANRGEIACRIFRTCKKLGIKTVAVYSEADANSQHVKLADEAICIGKASALESYLLPERIVEAAKITGANAVHPGYGFLSENAEFCEMLEKAGITFVGPKSAVIREMGDKIKSKVMAESVNVMHIPGFVGAIRDETHLLEVANKIGYPVMVKAANGGGGKGMRRANNDEECREGYRLSLAEAKSAFNSSTMLVEKFIVNPRHIEFQIIADNHGNAVFVHERECSVQRRNQKLVEEAPSTFLTPEQRARIGAEAVKIAKAAGYSNAGTVEFLMGNDGQHYYLEMNTRLQVEHPITEMISGLDLVEQQIRVAAGLPLTVRQEDIKINGWAVEARVCAEDPLNDFLPSIGTLNKFVPPKGCRVDAGFVEGDKISIYYDSLLAKVITHAPTRNEALAEMARALDSTVIRGLSHNICFLREVMQHPKFVQGKLTTNFIAENFPKGFTGHIVTENERKSLLSAAMAVYTKSILAQTSVIKKESSAQAELQQSRLSGAVMRAKIGEDTLLFYVTPTFVDGEGRFSMEFTPISRVDEVPAEDAQSFVLEFEADYDRASTVFSVCVDEAPEYDILQTLEVSPSANHISLLFKGSPYQFEIMTPAEAKYLPYMPAKEVIDLTKTILSPMPGGIYSINVKPGDQVVAGQELLVVEAMKMQNSIKALKPAHVKAVHVKKGDTVASEQLLIELE